MKSLSKLVASATGLMILAMAAFSVSPVFATSPGQLEGGSLVYEAKDITQNGAYASSITANACDELEYSIELHNTEFNTLSNINVNVNLPSASATSNTSTMTATTSLGGTSGTYGTATVNLSSAQGISYVAGSTELFNQQGSVIENLPDSITSSGVNVGSLNGSTIEFVNFKAKVNCPAPAPQPVFTCNLLSLAEPATKQIQASVQYSAQNGAAFKNVTYTFGDGSTPLTTTSTNTNYTYANYGTYTVTATVAFDVNGSSQSVTNSNCSKVVSFTAPATPTTPAATTPTQLVNTGPGSVVALFGVTTVAGAVAHRLFGRRLARLFVK